MKICLICDTPYQLLNCINIACNLHKNDILHIYVGLQFKDSEKIVERVKDEQIFDNVYLFYPASIAKSFLRKVKNVPEIIHPKKRIGTMLKDDNVLFENTYDVIYMSVPVAFAKAMIGCNEQAEVVYYDDGTGSYSGDIADGLSSFYKGIYVILRHSMKFLYPSKLYVNNKELCKSTTAPVIKQLPKLQDMDETFWGVIKRVFAYKEEELYDKHKFVYLMQPYEEKNTEKYDELEKEIESIICQTNENCIVRVHPRQKDKRISGMHMDTSGNMWELLCADKITDEHILLGICSTAQIVPKMLFDKEPYLIFIYHLFGDVYTAEKIKAWDEIVKSIRGVYSKPDKIYVPESMEALKEYLEKGKL